jgi:hypothetical protein
LEGIVIYDKKKSDKQEFWKNHVRAWKASAMTQAEYCRAHGLKEHRLTYYKLRFAKPSSEAKAASEGIGSRTGKILLPLKISSPSPAAIRVKLENGMLVEFSDFADPAWITKIIGSIVQ